ncbi:arginase [Rhodophyticola sp. CCM32]|uniref:arginase n=1 Tax=Rhodophyticola sp. CCM32 TaxID=2916397 RepID=UPI00107FB613|nr:arginase [Rhodophyticola sp. CCM32]QBY00455.1 arginase [Rhodophyticola sp. CCM32]
MPHPNCLLIGAPVDSGKRRAGCLMGPDAYRTAGLADTLASLGASPEDLGNIAPAPLRPVTAANPALHGLAETIAWTEALTEAARDAMARGFPIFLGGDHSLSLGTVAGVASHAARAGRPQFLLWLDAHADMHTPDTTTSGHLHGTPVAYATGRAGFEAFPPMPAPIPQDQVCILGLRSVDRQENEMLGQTGIAAHDMRAIDEYGVAPPLRAFLEKVATVNGFLHVSLDVDFLDPGIAPAVGTTVPGGATFREAHLVMEILHDSGLVTSLDLVELNPFLDERGRTASLMVDLTASLMGRRVFDRPTRSFAA